MMNSEITVLGMVAASHYSSSINVDIFGSTSFHGLTLNLVLVPRTEQTVATAVLEEEEKADT